MPSLLFWKKNKQKTPKKKKSKKKVSKKVEKTVEIKIGEVTKADLLESIPTINETPSSQRATLFIKKLRLCSIMFNWGDLNADREAKDKKRQQLMELVEFIGKGKNLFTEQVLRETINMLRANLFRALPPPLPEEDMDEDEPVFEPSWPHLQIVYEFFLRFIVSGDVEVRQLKPLIDGRFVQQVLVLFNSQDHRERDYLKTILHRIYAKFMTLRSFIRRSINNSFYTFIYETGQHNGVAELLEILGSIINGFASPLKQEHKNFLKNVLVPMHKVTDITPFHPQLSYCVTQFVDKDPSLAVSVIGGLLRFWPMVSSSKQALFLNELEELLELTQPAEFATLIPVLFRQVSLSIASDHFQVAERTLFLWHNEYISGLIADHRAQILPIIYPALGTSEHWNATVNNLSQNVLKIFIDIDPDLVEECGQRHEKQAEERRAQRIRNVEAWSNLEKRVARSI